MSFRLKNKIRELDDKVNDSEFDNSNLRFDLSNAESKIRSLTNQLKLLEDKNKELINKLANKENELEQIDIEFNNYRKKFKDVNDRIIAKDKKIGELEFKICFLLVQINKLYEVLPDDNKIPEIKILLNYLNSSN